MVFTSQDKLLFENMTQTIISFKRRRCREKKRERIRERRKRTFTAYYLALR